MSFIIPLLFILLMTPAWFWGHKRFGITDAEGNPVKGGYFRATDELGNPVKAVICRDRYLFDALMTALFSVSQLTLWLLGVRSLVVLAALFLPWSAWLLWKGLRAPKRPTPI